MLVARLGSLLFWGFVLVSSVLMFPVALLTWALTRPFDHRTRALHQLTCFWGSLYTWVNPLWKVRITGREHLRRGETYVLVANHLSLIDILVLFRLFAPFTWVSKVENFKVPFVGWNMRLNNYIPLRRGDKSSAAAMLEQCRARLADGVSVMMFPEGTRSRDGNLQAFKPGAFQLAADTGRSVLPIAMHGSAQALPRRGFVLRGHQAIQVEILPQVPVEVGADVAELTARVHHIIGERVELLRARAQAQPDSTA